MSEEISPDRVRLVERLGEALNHKNRMEHNAGHSVEDRMRVEEEVNDALEAVRTDKAGEKTQGDESPAA